MQAKKVEKTWAENEENEDVEDFEDESGTVQQELEEDWSNSDKLEDNASESEDDQASSSGGGG